MKKVEVHPAFWWYCDDCSEQNFGQLISIDQEAQKELREIDENYTPGDYMMMPKTVKCKNCGSKFKTSTGDEDEII